MKPPTKTAMRELLDDLRGLAPKRPLTYGESLQLARLQAARLRSWARADQADINLIWLVRQKLVPVHFVASHKLGEESGLTTNGVSGKLEVFINDHEPPVRQRFSLLHEWKHVLDFADAPILHARLGQGDTRRQANMVEWVANEFAAHVLMPTALVKRAWFGLQDISAAAALFNVSSEAMTTRLEKLGLIGEPKTSPRVYFRRVALPTL